MTDVPIDPDAKQDSGDHASTGPDRKYPGTPRWLKVFGIVVLIVVVVVVILLAGGHTSPVQHGP